MRVLRLANSADVHGPIPDEQRSHALAARALAEAPGEAVETVTRQIWPNAALPGAVDGWIEKYRPDVVFLWVAPYWFTFGLIPQPIRRRGTIPRSLGRIAKRAGEKRPITRRLGQFRRWAILRRNAATLHFQPEEVLERMEQCIVRILRHEDVVLVVRGPEFPLVQFDNRAGRLRAEARRLVVHRGLETLCHARHVTYLGVSDGLASFDRGGQLMADGVHRSAAGHATLGGEEAEAMANAWLAAHPSGELR